MTLRLILLLLSAGLSVRGQEEAFSPVSGYLQTTCLGGSDTRVSVPFQPVPKWSGPLGAVPTSPGSGIVRFELDFPVAITAGSFAASLHYLLCREPSAVEGRHFRVVAHGAGTVDVEASLVDLTGLSPGYGVEIFPAWTLDSLFPPGDQDTFHVSSGRLAVGRESELLLFNLDSTGIRLAPSRRYFINEDGWLEAGTFAPAGDVVIPPGEAFLVRHPEGAMATVFTALQQVYAGVVTLPLRVSDGRRQDTTLAPPRPVAVTLAELDLAPGSFTESPSTDPGQRADELLVFDNAATGLNKTPSATYFRSGGQWIEDAAGFPVADAVAVEPSAGLLVRKAAGASDLVLRWANEPAYDLSAP